jgi:hypothetical protein
MAEEFVLTPGGYRPKSLVHFIEPGQLLDCTGNRYRKLDASRNVLEDFGSVVTRPGKTPLMPASVNKLPAKAGGAAPALGTGWIVYADWSNDTGSPIASFTTTWTVPPAPTTQSGQLIFLFNGIQNSTMIYQPVLQWGVGAATGGGYSWAVASWYADGQGGQAFYSTLASVNTGDVLVGVITLTGQSAGSFSYNCQFQGIDNTSLPITNVQELTWCAETLEAYGLQTCSDYPNTACTQMGAIGIQTSGQTNPAVTWSATNLVTDCNQLATVVSDANPGGEVDLCY